MCKVSILVPVYNVEKYIERCARSLFEQTYADLEYVFVDDCTPDGSVAILNRVLEDYPNRKTAVKIIHHEKNRGVAAARNTTFDNAKGDFITMVDADDWLELNAVELLVEKQRETDADLVSGWAKMYYKDHVEEIREPVFQTKDEAIKLRLADGWNNVIWGRLIRRSIIENNHIRALEGCDMGDDKYMLPLIFYYANSFAVCESYLYNYECRNDQSIVAQMGSEKNRKRRFQYLKNWQGVKDFFADKNPYYYEEACKQTVLHAQILFKGVLKSNDREMFHQIIKIIDDIDEKHWPIIGWKKNGLRGWFLHSYGCMWMSCQGGRIIGFVKRLPKLLIKNYMM